MFRVLSAASLPLFTLAITWRFGVAGLGAFTKEYMLIQVLASITSIPLCLNLLKNTATKGQIYCFMLLLISCSGFLSSVGVFSVSLYLMNVVLLLTAYILRRSNQFTLSYLADNIIRYAFSTGSLFVINDVSELFPVLTAGGLLSVLIARLFWKKNHKIEINFEKSKVLDSIFVYITYLFSQNFLQLLLLVCSYYLSDYLFGQIRLMQTYILGSTIIISLPIQKAVVAQSQRDGLNTFDDENDLKRQKSLHAASGLMVTFASMSAFIIFHWQFSSSQFTIVSTIPLLVSVYFSLRNIENAAYAKVTTNNRLQFASTTLSFLVFLSSSIVISKAPTSLESFACLLGLTLIFERVAFSILCARHRKRT